MGQAERETLVVGPMAVRRLYLNTGLQWTRPAVAGRGLHWLRLCLWLWLRTETVLGWVGLGWRLGTGVGWAGWRLRSGMGWVEGGWGLEWLGLDWWQGTGVGWAGC